MDGTEGLPLLVMSISTLGNSMSKADDAITRLSRTATFQSRNTMNPKAPNLHELAKRYFIDDTGLCGIQLTRKIQIAQGHLDCFATGKVNCVERDCPWRGACLNDLDVIANDANSEKIASVVRPDESGTGVRKD